MPDPHVDHVFSTQDTDAVHMHYIIVIENVDIECIIFVLFNESISSFIFCNNDDCYPIIILLLSVFDWRSWCDDTWVIISNSASPHGNKQHVKIMQ